MEIKHFAAVWLSIVIATSVFVVFATSRFQNEINPTNQEANHFSVHWMGFVPTNPSYSSQYPDYVICINNLVTDPLVMSIALQIKNQEARGYWFKVAPYGSQPTGWSLPTVPLGFADVDQTLTFQYQPSRTKPSSIPSGILTEAISMVVGAYYDSGLTNLYSQDNFTAVFKFIDRTSGSWATMYHETFDDGTMQGWSGYSSPSIDPTYYRSFPYSFKTYSNCYKSYSISAGYGEAYLIFAMRSSNWGDFYIQFDGVTYFRPDAAPSTNTWYQFAIPMKIGVTTLVRIYFSGYNWLDDTYVIAK